MPARRQSAITNPVEQFRQHLTLKLEGGVLVARSEKIKKDFKEWIRTTKDAYRNEKGSYFFDLPETIEVLGKKFKGMELRRAVSVSFDEEKSEEILKEKGDRVYKAALSTYIDQDKVSRLHQEGKITDEELDSMFVESESFSFYPVEGEVL